MILNLPPGLKPENLVADPHRRTNHLFHALTNTVIHVDEATYAAVLSGNADSSTRNTETAPSGKPARVNGKFVKKTVETGMTSGADEALPSAIETDTAPDPTLDEGDETPTLEELKVMAEGLGLILADDATPEDIQAAVLAAVGGANASQ